MEAILIKMYFIAGREKEMKTVPLKNHRNKNSKPVK